jgi:hypothetical protein
VAFGSKKSKDEDRESKWTPAQWLYRAEKILRGANGLSEVGGRNAAVGGAQATVALVYEVRRTNELLEQLVTLAGGTVTKVDESIDEDDED